jgi:Uma2 family endonuclease
MSGRRVNLMSSPTVTPAIPPLRDGDRLTREEFERRYDAMPDLKKAELIDGVVYMPSPVNQERHGGPHFDVITWLGIYRALTAGVDGGDNSSVRLPGDNEPQPDVSLFIQPGRGGQVRLDGGYLEGGPELVVEVSASSAGLDRGPKMRLYQRSRVREYVIWLVDQQEVEWHVLRQGQYQRLAAQADGTLRSEVFPGLWLDAAALVNRDIARVLTVLQQGIATPEHAAFVQRLAAAATP